jgi:hypothetical protein
MFVAFVGLYERLVTAAVTGAVQDHPALTILNLSVHVVLPVFEFRGTDSALCDLGGV